MAKRKKTQAQPPKKETSAITVADGLDSDVLDKLQAAKKELKKVEQENEEKLQAKRREARKEREANKSFEELLNEYEKKGTK